MPNNNQVEYVDLTKELDVYFIKRVGTTELAVGEGEGHIIERSTFLRGSYTAQQWYWATALAHEFSVLMYNMNIYTCTFT